jgi:alpha-beta hydrolase superfamily lysophospholipase
MKHHPRKDLFFTAADGLHIAYSSRSAEPERARLVIAHGLGEHSGRYGDLIRQLLGQGIGVWALDHRGHGLSQGPRGHLHRFEDYIRDLHRLISIARSELVPGHPLFLLGHSMGGLIALHFAARYPELLAGLVVSSPALGLPQAVPLPLRLLSRLASFLWPGVAFNNRLDPTCLSHDETVVQAYIDDPLVHSRITARWSTEFFRAMQQAHRLGSGLRVPILMQIADDDRLTSAPASQYFFEKLTLADKTLHCYAGCYHEIYNEIKELRLPVWKDLIAWLVSRCRPGSVEA